MDLAEHYPDCLNAVNHCEHRGNPIAWDIARNAELSPQLVLEAIREALLECAQLEAHAIAAEMLHPSFMHYLRAKLGCM